MARRSSIPRIESSELDSLRQKLGRFREAQRGTGYRLPEELWERAAAAVRRHGLARTAAVLRLDYYSLKRRADTALPVVSEPQASFVEVFPTANSYECNIERVKRDGTRVRVQLKGGSVAEVAAFGERLWRAAR